MARGAAIQAASGGAQEHVNRLDQSVAKLPKEPDWEAYALDDARAWVSTVTPEVWERDYLSDGFPAQKRPGRNRNGQCLVPRTLSQIYRAFLPPRVSHFR